MHFLRMLAVLSCAAVTSCQGRPAPAAVSASSDGARTDSAPMEEAVGYPSGPWREAPLRLVVLSASQIAVAHRDSKVVLQLPAVVAAQRSKHEALQKALNLRRELHAHPERFASMAQRESDERTTAELGGSLGVFRAAVVPLEFVDALAHLEPGQISRVIETDQGYHIVQRNPVPPETELALSHVVIKATDSTGWRRSDRAPQARDREAALALARRVAEQAAADPSRFAEFVREHSDADDVERAGDMGVWSRHADVGSEHVLFEAAWRLAPGAVSGVVESGTGFHVLKRTAVDARKRWAVSVIPILHDGAQAQRYENGPARTREKGQAMARKLIAELSRHPERFAQRQVEYCDIGVCDHPQVFRAGRGLVAIERAVAMLEPHEISAAPVDSPIGWLVLRREDEATVPEQEAPQLQFELSAPLAASFDQPAPPAAEVEPSPAELAHDLRQFGRYASERMKLDAVMAERFNRIIVELTSGVENDPNREYELHLARADQQMLELLGPERLEELTRHRRSWFAAREH